MSQPLTLKRLAARTVATVAGLVGLSAFLRQRRRAAGDFRVYILEYHGVDPQNREWEGTISQRRFHQHVAWLKRHYRIVTVADAADALASGELTQDLAVLTFDDGYLNNVEGAWPVLRELGVPATIYLTTGFLDGDELWFDIARRALAAPVAAKSLSSEAQERLAHALNGWPTPLGIEAAMKRLKRLPAKERLAVVEALREVQENPGEPAQPMSWDQARELQAAGIELGAHTVHHPILSLTDEQEKEIAGSLKRLEEELGQAPTTFAMPNGGRDDYDQETLDILRRLGFRAACTTRRGSNAPGCDLLELRRIGVGSDSIFMLSARLAGLFDEGVRRLLPF